MRTVQTQLGQLAIAGMAIAAVTVLGLYDKISGDALVAVLSAVIGAVFGSAATSSGVNGAVRVQQENHAVVEQAIARGIREGRQL